MQSKVKVELELVHAGHSPEDNEYRVKSVANSLDPRPGDYLTEQEAQSLIVRCGVSGGSVTVREAKR